MGRIRKITIADTNLEYERVILFSQGCLSTCCTSYSLALFHFDEVFLKTYSVRPNFFNNLVAVQI